MTFFTSEIHSFTLANEIVHRVNKKLGVQTRSIGFDNEVDMVKNLAATPRSQGRTCFVHGAGESFFNAVCECDTEFFHM